MPDKTRNEEIRHAVLDHLYLRQLVSQSAPTIRRNLSREITRVTDEEVEAACKVLVGLGHLVAESDDLGSTAYYQISATGIIHYERSDRAL